MKFLGDNKELYRHEKITTASNAKYEQKIKSQFNETVKNAIFVIPRDPYATGSDYIGVKLLINSPITDATQNTQLEGRVTRLCGFSSEELNKGKSTPITHYILKLTNDNGKGQKVETQLASQVGATYRDMHESQSEFYEKRINTTWKIGQLPPFKALQEEVTVVDTVTTSDDINQYFGVVEKIDYKSSPESQVQFTVKTETGEKTIVVTENEYKSIRCELTGIVFKETFEAYEAGYLGYSRTPEGTLKALAFAHESDKVDYYNKIYPAHKYYYIDFACRAMNVGEDTAYADFIMTQVEKKLEERDQLLFVHMINKKYDILYFSKTKDPIGEKTLMKAIMEHKYMKTLAKKFNIIYGDITEDPFKGFKANNINQQWKQLQDTSKNWGVRLFLTPTADKPNEYNQLKGLFDKSGISNNGYNVMMRLD